MHVPSHLLIILNSSIRFRPRSSYPPSLFHTGNPCSLILLLLAGDVELNPGPSALTFTHLSLVILCMVYGWCRKGSGRHLC